MFDEQVLLKLSRATFSVISKMTAVTEASVNSTQLAENMSSQHVDLDLSDFTTYKAAMFTHRYILPFIVLFGLIGNTLSFLVMLKRHNRIISCCNYIGALALCDNLMLLTGADYWTLTFKHRPAFRIECKFNAWLLHAVSFAAVIFMFSMTVDRFLCICFPIKARNLCVVPRARKVIIITPIITALYTLPYAFTAEQAGKMTCLAVATNNKLAVAYNWLNVFLASVVPFVGLLTMNGLIIYRIRKRSKLAVSVSRSEDLSTNGTAEESVATIGQPQRSSTKQDRNNQLTVMLLLVTFTFLLLTLPQYIRYVVAAVTTYWKTPHDYAEFILLAHVSNRCFYINSAVNFFLYCMSGSRFRKDVRDLLRRKKRLFWITHSYSNMNTPCSSQKEFFFKMLHVYCNYVMDLFICVGYILRCKH